MLFGSRQDKSELALEYLLCESYDFTGIVDVVLLLDSSSGTSNDLY